MLLSVASGSVGRSAHNKHAKTGVRSLSGLTPLLFLLLTLAGIVPVWLLDYFPSSDGAAHLATAASLLHIGDPTLPAFSEYLMPNWQMNTNQTTTILLLGLMQVFAPVTAEKVLVSVYLAMLPLAFFYAVGFKKTPLNYASFLIFPFVTSRILYLGFYNYLLGLVLVVFVLGYYLRHFQHPSVRNGIVLCALVVVTYILHVLAAAIAVLGIGSLAFLQFAPQLWRHWSGAAAANQRISRRLWIGVAAAVVICLLVGALVINYILGFGSSLLHFESPLVKLVRLGSLSVLVTFTAYDLVFAIALNALFGVLALAGIVAMVRRKRYGMDEVLFGTILIFVLCFLVMPAKFFLPERFMPSIYFLLLLWLGTQELFPRGKPILMALCVALAAISLVYRLPVLSRLSAQQAEMASVAPYLEPGSVMYTIETVNFDPKIKYNLKVVPAALGIPGFASEKPIPDDLFYRVAVERNGHGYVAAKAKVVDLSNYQFYRAFFPLKIRPERNPEGYVPVLDRADTGTVDNSGRSFDAYAEDTGGRIDYVLVWGSLDAMVSADPDGSVQRELESRFDLVYVTKPRGLARLYRWRGE